MKRKAGWLPESFVLVLLMFDRVGRYSVSRYRVRCLILQMDSHQKVSI